MQFHHIFHRPAVAFNLALRLIHCFYFLINVSLNAKAFVDERAFHGFASCRDYRVNTPLIPRQYSKNRCPTEVSELVLFLNLLSSQLGQKIGFIFKFIRGRNQDV